MLPIELLRTECLEEAELQGRLDRSRFSVTACHRHELGEINHFVGLWQNPKEPCGKALGAGHPYLAPNACWISLTNVLLTLL
jgi:hypothetical protein